MIKRGFIKKQIQKSRQAGKSSRFLSEFVLFIADKALRERYGGNYSTKCLQSSVAIQMILKEFGINSAIWGQHVCVAEVYQNSGQLAWGGFLDQEHHVWLCTELSELVDLTISQIHLHPAVTRHDMIPMPAIWWQEVGSWPCTIRYLPTARIRPGLLGEEKEDLDAFVRLVPRIIASVLDNSSIEEGNFAPVLYGEDSMNDLHRQGNPWLVKTIRFQQDNIPLPPWVQRKERELMEVARRIAAP